jgi:hypothetical protein
MAIRFLPVFTLAMMGPSRRTGPAYSQWPGEEGGSGRPWGSVWAGGLVREDQSTGRFNFRRKGFQRGSPRSDRSNGSSFTMMRPASDCR